MTVGRIPSWFEDQLWADYLDELKNGADVVPISVRRAIMTQNSFTFPYAEVDINKSLSKIPALTRVMNLPPGCEKIEVTLIGGAGSEDDTGIGAWPRDMWPAKWMQ